MTTAAAANPQHEMVPVLPDVELQEWLDSLEYVVKEYGAEAVKDLLERLQIAAQNSGIHIPFTANTPYINTIASENQPPFPGNRELERRIKSIIRWNALAMVVKANRIEGTIGGHIATYQSSATLYEVGFNHFFRGKQGDHPGDVIYFQGHASPGIYARAFLEGRLSEEQLVNFRRELQPGGGLSSYPHPWLMPTFWEYPTVSMGLGPIMSIYHARFIRYMEDRGLKAPSDQKVWAFLGDGECDEPEALGSISLAAREHLDNLIFVINCNLQRLDGPVRGNGKIIQELEALFRGAGWNVIKVLWGDDWDPLFAKDDGALVKRVGEIVDGWAQKYIVEPGSYMREHMFGVSEKLQKLVEHLSDHQLRNLRRGGHDPEKVYAAYKAAVEHKNQPTVILAHTIKGYGMGEAGAGKNIAHQQKKLSNDELIEFRNKFALPLSDEEAISLKFYKPADHGPEIKYLKERRAALGGTVPSRVVKAKPVKTPDEKLFEEFYSGTEGREASTTMVFVRMLSKLMRDPNVGKLIVPIVPDEARTFGMESLFREFGIYSHVGQQYEPVDAASLLYYKEAKEGAILEEGITEAGSMSSMIAAGCAYANHGINTIPMFIFYSMFGFQRIGDLIWAAADMRTKGFLLGGTSGRTTLNGEGLQHEDGHSHVIANTVPNLMSYDPAFAYELAVIIRDGIYRMYEKQEDIFYYVTVMNENYPQPKMPADPGVKEGILKGLYRFKPAANSHAALKAQLLGSGTILNEVLKAQTLLEKFGVAADVWSVTSYKCLQRDAHDVERWNLLHPTETPKESWLKKQLATAPKDSVYVAASDYLKILPDSLAKWIPGPFVALGTDGFGRSESRPALRDFFEVDAKWVAYNAIAALVAAGKAPKELAVKALKELGINADKPNPVTQ